MDAVARYIEELRDRQAIADVKSRYCRAVDRCDLPLLKSIYWDDSTAHYGIFDGLALEYAAMTVSTLRQSCQSTMHLLGNATLELHGDRAEGETYVLAYHAIESIESIGALLDDAAMSAAPVNSVSGKGNEAPCSFIVGGRYLDHFTRRHGEWRIQSRAFVWDWCERGPANMMFNSAGAATRLLLGCRDRSDASYAHFARPR